MTIMDSFSLHVKRGNMFNMLAGMPIFESTLLPKAEEVTRRIEWITRNSDGTLTFRHDLRKEGSKYETHTKPRSILYLSGMGFVMHPDDAAVIRISSLT